MDDPGGLTATIIRAVAAYRMLTSMANKSFIIIKTNLLILIYYLVITRYYMQRPFSSRIVTGKYLLLKIPIW